MSDVNPDDIDVTARPYLADLFGSAPQPPKPQPQAPAQASQGGLANLYQAATGAGTPQAPVAPPAAEPSRLHAVPPLPPTPGAPTTISVVPADNSLIQLTAAAFPPAPTAAAPAASPWQPSTADQKALPGADWDLVDTFLLRSEDMDWDLVDRLVQLLELPGDRGRTQADFDAATASARPETEVEQTAWEQIIDLITTHVDRAVSAGGDAYDWTDQRKANHVQAVFDAAFRYGRLAPLLRADLESFNAYGAEKVVVTLPDGSKETLPPIANTNADLEKLIQRVVEDRGRSFAVPHGKIRIDIGGARFTAVGGPSILPKPIIAVRKHNLVDIGMPDLVERGALTPRMAAFLSAATRSHQSILVSGWAYTGKTTFLRALASALPADEPLVTIETERELYLDKLPERHHEVIPFQYLPDANTGDDRSAQFPLEKAIEYANRMNAQSFLFGEILGDREAAAAIKAMQGGKGTSSTVHAKSAYKAIQRFSNLLTGAAGMSDDLVPQREIMESINLIVHLELIQARPGRPQKRVVREIAQVVEGDARPGRPAMPIARTLYRYDKDADAFLVGEPPTEDMQEELIDAGLTPDFFSEAQA